jgi:hypothetical protein
MAGLLSWNEEQREKAGLARPGTAGQTLRLPTSPFHRTPSSPSLNSDFFSEPTSLSASASAAGAGAGGGKESLADLWASFLEQSVDEAAGAGAGAGGPSRKDSMSSVATAGGGRPDTRGHT